MNEDSLRENNYARTTLDYGCVEIQDEMGDYFMDEVGHAWKERFVIARNYDIAVYEAGIDTTDLEVTSEGFYLDLMMTRGSDPTESKSTLGADHLAVKEVKQRSSQVAGRHAVIAFTEEEGDLQDRVVFYPWPRTRDLEVWPWRTIATSLHSRRKSPI